jgi:phosphoribosylglycinamide formyltransferase 1
MLALAGHVEPDPELEIVAVISPKPDCPGAIAATQRGLPLRVVPYQPAETYPERMCDALTDADWVCLAGYMKLLPSQALLQHERRVLNIHPALLPKFGGKGMYGHYVHQAVIAAGETESGCTVHYVTEEYDEGQIILQAECSVGRADTPETLAAKVLKLEHKTYYQALKKVSDDNR